MTENNTPEQTDTASTPDPEALIAEIKQRLVDESDEDIDVADITPEMSLRDDLGMDSMQAVSLSLDLEDSLNIKLDDEDLTRLTTVGDVIEIVQSKIAARD